MNCLLCDQQFTEPLSWQTFFGLQAGTMLCDPCMQSFQRIDDIQEGSVVDQIHSLYAYNEGMQLFLHHYKFLQDVALATVFAQELSTVLKKSERIVPIPIHPKRKMERTFSHVEELLQAAQLPFIQLLEKRSMERMGTKTRAERFATPPLFQLVHEVTIEPTTYVLVDDIVTTGTTLSHAAALLKEAGALRVEAVTLIRA